MKSAKAIRELLEPESSAAHISPEMRALEYELKAKAGERNRHGVFYTPIKIADEIASKALLGKYQALLDSASSGFFLLDPACGSGIFLICAYRRLMNFLVEQSPKNASRAGQVLRQCIFGVDLDTHAVEACRSLLISCALEFDPSLPKDLDLNENIKIGNSLLNCSDSEAQYLGLSASLNAELFDWKAKFKKVAAAGGFDVVLGNPPYGLSRNSQLSAVENMALRRIFSAFTSGKVNKYLCFMALGFSLLRNGGCLSMIVPNSWLGIRNASALRRKFLEQSALHEIEIFDHAVFADPSVEAVVLRAYKDRPSEDIRIMHRAADKIISSNSIPLRKCLKNPHFSIPARWSSACDSLFESICAQSFALGSAESAFIPAIALQAYAVGKGNPPQSMQQVKDHCFHSELKNGPESFPYLEGSDVKRYRIEQSKKFLKYGPWLAEPQSLDRFSSARLVLREILGKSPYLLSACFTDKTLLYNKSILHIHPKAEASKEMLKALATILNSRLGSFVIKFYGRKSQRKLFPKLVNDDLKLFPLLISLPARAQELAKLYDLRAKLESSNPKTKKIENEIDRAVFGAYSLSEADVATLEEFLLEGN